MGSDQPDVLSRTQRADVRIGRLAVDAGLISPETVEKCLLAQRSRMRHHDYVRLGELLVSLGRMSRADIVRLLADQGVVIYRCDRTTRQYNVPAPHRGRGYFDPIDGSPMDPVTPESVRELGVIGVIHQEAGVVPDSHGLVATGQAHPRVQSAPTSALVPAIIGGAAPATPLVQVAPAGTLGAPGRRCGAAAVAQKEEETAAHRGSR
jgi:hypothetical protein